MSPEKLFLFISNQMSLGGNAFAGHLGLTGLKFQRSSSKYNCNKSPDGNKRSRMIRMLGYFCFRLGEI